MNATRLCFLLTGLLAVNLHAADLMTSDPERWFRDAYAPLWNDSPGEHMQDILAYYASEVESHAHNGTVFRAAKEEWLTGPMEEWLAEGWLRSELTGLEVDRINASTASFKARWVDHYTDTPQAASCGWYLADLVEGRWQFTAYADLDCAAHGF